MPKTRTEDRAALIDSRRLPRLLYIGDVPVEPTFAGAALLHRLLQAYPSDSLAVIQNEYSQINRVRLPGVRYATYRLPLQRLTRTRLHRWAGLVRYLTARRRLAAIEPLAANFKAEAVLTVAAGCTWISAAAFANKHQLPLHLIVHDEVLATLALPGWLQPSLSKTFAAVCRQAANRLCISPQMADAYSQRGAPADVLYPSRAAELKPFASPVDRPSSGALRFGYAGSINSPGYVSLLESLADVIQPLGGKLVLFAGPNPPPSLVARPNVESRGFVPNAQLLAALRDAVDVLFLPMSFEADEKQNMRLSFPSKLTDYTAACLPLLICGPAYCSAARWARDNPGVAELVDSDGRITLESAVKRLAARSLRDALARRASQVGQTMFSHEAITSKFLEALRAKPAQ